MQVIETNTAYIVEFQRPPNNILKKRYDIIDKGVQTCYITSENKRFIASIIFYKTDFKTWGDVKKWCEKTIRALTASAEERGIWNTSVKMQVLSALKIYFNI
ncbi:MAG: hypothetical protein QXF26_02305 [Candidatus Bathyarchaeia archaeon]